MDERPQTLIIGGGISGLACARALCDAGRPFLLITDRLGGRMYHSADASMNFGATYINADYRHVGRYVGRGLPFRLASACGHPDAGPRPLLHWRNLARAGPLARLALRLCALRAALADFRKAAQDTPQHALAPHFPLLDRLRRQPAAEVVAELRLGALHDDYFALAFRATCFRDPLAASALFYLGALLPVVVPTWVADFTHAYSRLTRGYEGRILLDRVCALGRHGGAWQAVTASGRTVRASAVVLALPAHNLAALLAVPTAGVAAPATVLYVRGERRPAYHGRAFLLLRPGAAGPALVWRQRGGRDLVFADRPGPDLAAVYRSAAVEAAVSWKTAVVLSGCDWAPLTPAPGLYLAGDHNLCGLEDSYLTGLCAARHILRSPGGGPP
jgi:hypothetical protein